MSGQIIHQRSGGRRVAVWPDARFVKEITSGTRDFLGHILIPPQFGLLRPRGCLTVTQKGAMAYHQVIPYEVDIMLYGFTDIEDHIQNSQAQDTEADQQAELRETIASRSAMLNQAKVQVLESMQQAIEVSSGEDGYEKQSDVTQTLELVRNPEGVAASASLQHRLISGLDSEDDTTTPDDAETLKPARKVGLPNWVKAFDGNMLDNGVARVRKMRRNLGMAYKSAIPFSVATDRGSPQNSEMQCVGLEKHGVSLPSWHCPGWTFLFFIVSIDPPITDAINQNLGEGNAADRPAEFEDRYLTLFSQIYNNPDVELRTASDDKTAFLKPTVIPGDHLPSSTLRFDLSLSYGIKDRRQMGRKSYDF